MQPIDLEQVCEFVNQNIVNFHQHRIQLLEELKLERLLRKNPYLFKAKNIETAGALISDLLNSFLSSSEEKLFGDFLEELAIYVAQLTCGGHKSIARGVDLEFINDDTHYVVSVKSGPNWGNSSQQSKLAQDLTNAAARLKQSQKSVKVQTVLGICYGKTKTSYLRGYLKIVGQNFWYLISENRDLYTEIIEPIGFRAREHNKIYQDGRNKLENRFTKQFIDQFCDQEGSIDWVELVEFNSQNFDLNKFI
jgi:Type II restriction endonuclease EcoO109I